MNQWLFTCGEKKEKKKKKIWARPKDMKEKWNAERKKKKKKNQLLVVKFVQVGEEKTKTVQY